MSQTRFLQQLRSHLYTGTDAKTIAIAAVKSQMTSANDGSFVLGRYQDGEGNIRTIIGANYSNGGTNSMSIYDFDKIESDALLTRVSTVETTLGISSDGTVTGETIVGRIEDVEELLNVLNGANTVEGSIKKQIKDAIDNEASARTTADTSLQSAIDAEKDRAEGAENTLQTNINNEVSARTAADTQIRTDFVAADNALQSAIDNEVSARTAADTALKNELMGEVSDADAKTIAALNDKIESVESAAKSYSIVEVTEGLGVNIEKAYQLQETVGKKSTLVGSLIELQKDDSLVSVALVNGNGVEDEKGQFLQFVYNLSDGTEKTVTIDVTHFLAQSEFGEGLQVSDAGVVSVIVDETSETFLSVSSNGVKLSGVQDAINNINTSLTNTITNFKTEYEGKVANLEAVDTNLRSAIDGEIVERKSADSALQTQLDAITGTGDSSISSKITNAINDLDSDVKGEGTFVDVTVTQVDGVITSVVVEESDIASAKNLSEEINRATTAEQANAKAISDETTARENAINSLNANVTSSNGQLVNFTVIEEKGKLTSATIDETKLNEKVSEIEQSIVDAENRAKSAVTKLALVDEDSETEDVQSMLTLGSSVDEAGSTTYTLGLSNVWDCGTFEYEQESTEE